MGKFTKFIDSDYFTTLVQRAYRQADKDHSGAMTSDELYTAMLHFYMEVNKSFPGADDDVPSKSEAMLLFRQFDADKSNTLSEPEFERFVHTLMEKKENNFNQKAMQDMLFKAAAIPAVCLSIRGLIAKSNTPFAIIGKLPPPFFIAPCAITYQTMKAKYVRDRMIASTPAGTSLVDVVKHGIVPDVVAKPFTPSVVVTVYYGKGRNKLHALDGNELAAKDVRSPPRVLWAPDKNAYYTLVMTDPDAPSRADPKYREIFHWIVGNIPYCQINKGETLVEYIGCGAPKGTGLHRYIFFIYKHSTKIDFSKFEKVKKNSLHGRAGQETGNFAARYGLGAPIGVQLFQGQYDESVLDLNKQLGM